MRANTFARSDLLSWRGKMTLMSPETTTTEVASSELFRLASDVVSALASPIRLCIIQALTQRPHSVDELVNRTGEKIGNVSQHLQRLSRAGLVEFQKQGTSRLYKLSHPQIIGVWLSLQDLAGAINPKAKAAEEQICPENLCSPLNPEQILNQIARRKSVLIDVRDEEDVFHTPIPHALSIPYSRLEKAVDQLPKSKTLYLVCRGRYCSLANQAVVTLRKKGFKAFRLRQSHFELNYLNAYSP